MANHLVLTGATNVAPARIDLTGVDALYANTDYIKIVRLDMDDGNNWDLTAVDTVVWSFFLKVRPDDADADAVATGVYLVADSTFDGTDSILAFQFTDISLTPANAGMLFFSAMVTLTEGGVSTRVPVLYGTAELREFSATAAAS